jgi:twitching motility two-component system response regulator PilH/chemotaxis family two-component system response regulator PixH
MVSILIVEDSATEASLLVDCLQKSGFDVLNVNTAEAAKAILSQRNFDAIVMDVVLPGQSGFGLCRELKNQEKTANIPIIICSSKSEKIDKNWGLKQGAAAYVTKPINVDEIINTVKDVVQAVK